MGRLQVPQRSGALREVPERAPVRRLHDPAHHRPRRELHRSANHDEGSPRHNEDPRTHEAHRRARQADAVGDRTDADARSAPDNGAHPRHHSDAKTRRRTHPWSTRPRADSGGPCAGAHGRVRDSHVGTHARGSHAGPGPGGRPDAEPDQRADNRHAADAIARCASFSQSRAVMAVLNPGALSICYPCTRHQARSNTCSMLIMGLARPC